MKFTIELDMDQFSDYDLGFSEQGFVNKIKEKIAERVVDEIFKKVKAEKLMPELKGITDTLKSLVLADIPEIKKSIVNAALRKRDLRELCTSDTQNRKFIEEIVNDCLRKKLGG